MTPEGGPDTGGNVTTVADVVLTGCPAFADGNSWIGETHRTLSESRAGRLWLDNRLALFLCLWLELQ